MGGRGSFTRSGFPRPVRARRGRNPRWGHRCPRSRREGPGSARWNQPAAPPCHEPSGLACCYWNGYRSSVTTRFVLQSASRCFGRTGRGCQAISANLGAHHPRAGGDSRKVGDPMRRGRQQIGSTARAEKDQLRPLGNRKDHQRQRDLQQQHRRACALRVRLERTDSGQQRAGRRRLDSDLGSVECGAG